MCKHTVMSESMRACKHTHTHMQKSAYSVILLYSFLRASCIPVWFTVSPQWNGCRRAFIRHCCWWQLMSAWWCVPALGSGMWVGVGFCSCPDLWTEEVMVAARVGWRGVGGVSACLLAEKLWNNAKFSIREPCKVTPVCSPCAKWPKLFGLSYREGGEKTERATDRERHRKEKKREEAKKKVWATVQPIWDVLCRLPVLEVTDKADPIFVECLKVLCE